MKTINYAHPNKAPKAVRKGSKTEKLIKLGQRKGGCTLTQASKELSKTGAEVSPSYVRAWLAPSYLKPLGYGVQSKPTANGKDLLFTVTCKAGAVDTSRSDVEQSKPKRQRTPAAYKGSTAEAQKQTAEQEAKPDTEAA